MRLAGKAGGGAAAVLLATLFLGSLARASDSDSRFDSSDRAGTGHLVWKPYRPADAPQAEVRDAAPTNKSKSRTGSTLARPVAHEEDQAGVGDRDVDAFARPATFVATDAGSPRSVMPGPLPFDDSYRAQRLGDDQPLGLSAPAIHRDSSVLPVQQLIAADPLQNPFADEPEDISKSKKSDKTDKRASSAPAELPLPGPSTDAPTLPDRRSGGSTLPDRRSRDSEPKTSPRDSSVDKSLEDLFKTDTPKPKTDNAPPTVPKATEPSPFPPPTTPDTDLTPRTTIPPIAGPPASEDTTTGHAACEKELNLLMANTVDKVQLDITPRPTDEASRLQWKVPGECSLGDPTFIPRDWAAITYTWKASALCHKPLYFEEVALERYGHSRGPILDPLVSAAHFFVTVPLLPYEMGVEPPCECEYSLGYYRPGDCAPWIIDGFPISLRGLALECTVATGAAFAIP